MRTHPSEAARLVYQQQTNFFRPQDYFRVAEEVSSWLFSSGEKKQFRQNLD